MDPKLKSKLKSIAIRISLLGPIAAVVIERIAHVFGICLGAH